MLLLSRNLASIEGYFFSHVNIILAHRILCAWQVCEVDAPGEAEFEVELGGMVVKTTITNTISDHKNMRHK